MTKPAVTEPQIKYKRRRSGTAAWHMSRKAVDQSLGSLYTMTNAEALELLVKARFGSWETVRCPHCGSLGEHYWRPLQLRWKCVACDKTFSVTSGSVFSHRKLSLQKLLASILTWVNSSAGQPALELKRHLDTTYNTTFTLQHKLREALVRGYNVGLLSGDIEIDGAHQSGRRSNEKRGKPQVSAPVTKDTPKQKLEETMLTGTAQTKARKRAHAEGRRDKDHGGWMPKDRRILLTVRKRSGTRGRGAVSTRVAIGVIEEAFVTDPVIQKFVALSESTLNTDNSKAYGETGKLFRGHRTVVHTERLVGPNGENCNQSEEINWRMDRAEQGMYLTIEPKYLLDYASEIAFRSDTRRISNGKQLRLLLNVAASVGTSEYWRGFNRGHHRTVELLYPLPQPAPSSGPRKGRNPLSNANGRPPR